ncbi:MAG: glycosyltransferase family 2 protein [Aureispira sp.]
MNHNPELSIIILCYRSEEGIIPFSQKVKEVVSQLTDSFEIVLVGNYIEGSNDRTKEIIEDLAAKDPVFKTICKPKKGMMGWDMKEGLALTTGNYLGVIDGDGQFPVESIAGCYKHIKTGNYGLVKTYREKRNDGFQRKFISVVYNLVFKILFPGVKANDINSKPKLFSRAVYEKMELTSDDWFIDAEIMIKISKMDIQFHEFPIEFLELEGRKSFVNVSTIFEFIRNLISFRLRGK